MPVRIVSLVVMIALGVTPAAASFEFGECRYLAAEEREACVDRKVAGRAVEPDDLLEFDALVTRDPGAALALLSVLESRFRADPSLLAEILDRQAEAYRILGDPERAAERRTAALESDAGVRALEWRAPGGELLWTSPLDVVRQRHLEAAKALASIDREDRARAVLAEALLLGAEGEIEELWAAVGDAQSVVGLDARPTPVVARPWYPRLPAAEVPIVGGSPFPLADARGDVLILDFWASWCEPCLTELPAIGRLYDSEKENGLQVIAVNMGESAAHAEAFARRMGLQMPVGTYDAALQKAFDAASLPTVIVADRQGRVRARWDGYREGLEAEIAALARRLLPLDEDPGEQIGEILRGGGALEVEWARDVPGGVDGLAVATLEGPDVSSSLVALGGRHALVYDGRGVVSGFVDRPVGAGALRRCDLDGDGRDELFSFRVGGTRVSRLDLDEGAHESWEAPAPLRDLVLLPPAEDREAVVAMATMSGLYLAGTDFEAVVVPGFASPRSLIVTREGGRRRLRVLESSRGLCRVDPADPESASCSAIGSGARLVAPLEGEEYGVLPRGVAAVAGRFLGGAERQIALITSTGQLVIVDSDSGKERFRARLDGPRALAAGDLDGDGVDELALAVGHRVLLLKGPPPDRARPRGDRGDRVGERGIASTTQK